MFPTFLLLFLCFSSMPRPFPAILWLFLFSDSKRKMASLGKGRPVWVLRKGLPTLAPQWDLFEWRFPFVSLRFQTICTRLGVHSTLVKQDSCKTMNDKAENTARHIRR